MILSSQQNQALELIREWYLSNNDEPFYLAGYAGTGKSTIVNEVIQQLEIKSIAYCAFTGKAASVLASKGNNPASTVHSLIYEPIVEPETKKVSFILKDQLDRNFNLIVLDECSMINDDLYQDLLSFDVPILILGDPGQLPPISGSSPFGEPNYQLTEVHRQAGDSNILKAATYARQGNGVMVLSEDDYQVLQSNPFNNKKDSLINNLIENKSPEDFQIICGTNKMRLMINSICRKSFGFNSYLPSRGEKIICLKNNRDLGLFNGQMFTMVDHPFIDESNIEERFLGSINCQIQNDEGRLFNIPIDMRPFVNNSFKLDDNKTNPFTYAYAITCHKSQGSQWDDVIIIDESYCFKELSDKWLYTAITRAAKKLWIIK